MNTEHRLDQRARDLHAVGLAHVPFPVTTRLHPQATTPARHGIWRPVMAGAMVFALAAVGILQLQTPTQKPAPTVIAAAPSAGLPVASPTTAMDNDPEFYAWLGSDANALHLEK